MAASADLLLTNARVVTLDPAQPRAEAVAIAGETIAAVGSRTEAAALAGPHTRRIDCQGMTLIPGIVDAHCHLLALASSWQGLDCGPQAAPSIEGLKGLVRRRAGETPPGRWIHGFGYDDLSLAEERHPTRWDLDQAAPCHPVRLDHRSGHATALNSRGLALAGIDRDTPDPVDGVIDRDPSTGEPTGLLLEMGGFLRQRLGRLRDNEALEAGVARLSERLLQYGITSVQDAGPTNDPERWETFRRLQASGRLQCRVTMLAGAACLEEFLAHGLGYGGGDDRLRLGHAKVMLTLTTGALQPDAAAVREIVAQAHRLGFPAAVHAVEREAVAAAAEAIRRAVPLSLRGRPGSPPGVRDRIEHCAECPPELVARVRGCGVTVVTQPGFIYWNGDAYRKRVEAWLLPHLYPVGALAHAGVPVAFGSDAPVIDPNPWPAIYSAVIRATRNGDTLPPEEAAGKGSPQGVTLLEALRMYTLGGAGAEGSQARKGAIRRGKLADLALLNADPWQVGLPGIKDIRAVLTVIGGQILWNEGV